MVYIEYWMRLECHWLLAMISAESARQEEYNYDGQDISNISCLCELVLVLVPGNYRIECQFLTLEPRTCMVAVLENRKIKKRDRWSFSVTGVSSLRLVSVQMYLWNCSILLGDRIAQRTPRFSIGAKIYVTGRISSHCNLIIFTGLLHSSSPSVQTHFIWSTSTALLTPLETDTCACWWFLLFCSIHSSCCRTADFVKWKAFFSETLVQGGRFRLRAVATPATNPRKQK